MAPQGDFASVFARTLGIEGDFDDDEADSGGATRYGITEAVAREAGYTGEMIDLPIELAVNIAKSKYWDLFRGDDVTAISPDIASELFDSGYNIGVVTVVQWLQRCLNALNREQRDFDDIKIDGLVGPGTLRSLRAFLDRRGAQGELVLMRALDGMQRAHYIGLAERRQKDEKFLFGWLLQRTGP